MPLPLHVPKASGFAALAELGEVPWRLLDHCYGKGVSGDRLHHDVARTLAGLGVPDDFDNAIDTLYANVCHQGTVYEASAYAVPFLAAVGGAELSDRQRRRIVDLLCAIAIGAGHDTEDGSYAGAFGDGVGELIRSAYEKSRALLAAVADREPGVRATIDGLVAYAADPGKPTFQAMRAAYAVYTKHDDGDGPDAEEAGDEDDDDAAELPETKRAAKAVPHERYRHTKLGDATLVRRTESGLVLRFDDGKERTIREAFVTKLA